MTINAGHLLVIETRMDALADAIRSRDWEAVEFQHDRVRRAVEKAQREHLEMKR